MFHLLTSIVFFPDTYNNPILAISNYKPNLYDLLLLDIRMPIMDGFEIYKEIRKIDGQKSKYVSLQPTKLIMKIFKNHFLKWH